MRRRRPGVPQTRCALRHCDVSARCVVTCDATSHASRKLVKTERNANFKNDRCRKESKRASRAHATQFVDATRDASDVIHACPICRYLLQYLWSFPAAPAAADVLSAAAAVSPAAQSGGAWGGSGARGASHSQSAPPRPNEPQMRRRRRRRLRRENKHGGSTGGRDPHEGGIHAEGGVLRGRSHGGSTCTTTH